MSHIFKDRDKEHERIKDDIRVNVDSIYKNSTEIQKNLSDLLELITIASWYISDEMIEIDKDYADAPIDHLKQVNLLFSEYNRELLNMDTAVRQCIFVMSRYFNFQDDGIKQVSERVKGDK